MLYGYYWDPFLQIWRIIKPFACWNNDKFKLHTMSIACVIMVMGYCKILICMRILLMIFKVALRTYCYFYTYSYYFWTASNYFHKTHIILRFWSFIYVFTSGRILQLLWPKGVALQHRISINMESLRGEVLLSRQIRPLRRWQMMVQIQVVAIAVHQEVVCQTSTAYVGDQLLLIQLT